MVRPLLKFYRVNFILPFPSNNPILRIKLISLILTLKIWQSPDPKHPSNFCCLLFSRYVMFDSFVTPRTVAHQAFLSMGFPRQEYWSGWPFPSPGDLPNPGIKPGSPALAGGFFITEPCGKSPPSNLMLVFVPFVYAIFSVSTIYKMGVQTFVILFMKCACLCVFINMFSTSNPLKSWKMNLFSSYSIEPYFSLSTELSEF